MHMSKEQFTKALPSHLRRTVTDEVIETVNAALDDPLHMESIRDNLLGFTNVLKETNFSLNRYVKAVKYISYKLMGDTSISAYTKTFPDKYQEMVSKGYDSKNISSVVTAYSKNKLVTALLEQSLIPNHIMYQDLYHKALYTQADLMVNANSETVRTKAADSILVQLKAPETSKISLDVTHKENNSINELKETLLQLSQQQVKLIKGGVNSAQEIAHSNLLIEGEIDE